MSPSFMVCSPLDALILFPDCDALVNKCKANSKSLFPLPPMNIVSHNDADWEDGSVFVFDKAALWVYLGIFSALVGAGLGLPVPEEIPIVTAGVWVGHSAEDPVRREIAARIVAGLASSPGVPFPADLPWFALVQLNETQAFSPPTPVPLRWWIMLPLCILGVVISDGLLYGMGRFWGPRLLEARWMRGLLPPEKRQRIEDNFHKYGVLVLLFARFLPTIRAPIFIMAGIMRVSFARFLIADGLYAIPGVSLLFSLAFWFGDSFRDLVTAAEARVDRAKPILILLLICAAGVYLFYHFLRHPVATGDPREELPVIGPQLADKMKSPEERANALNQPDWVSPDGSQRSGIRGRESGIRDPQSEVRPDT
jgi:membrane protein DedA with SNARE-associated domain